MRDDLKKVHKNLKALEASPHPPLARPPRLLKIASASAARCQPPPPHPRAVCAGGHQARTARQHHRAGAQARRRGAADTGGRPAGAGPRAALRRGVGAVDMAGCARRGAGELTRADASAYVESRRCVCLCGVARGAKARVLCLYYLFLCLGSSLNRRANGEWHARSRRAKVKRQRSKQIILDTH